MAQPDSRGAVQDRRPPVEDPADLPVGELIKRATEQTSRLVREELHLAQLEMQEKAKHAGIGLGLFSAAGLVALFGVATLIATAVLALATALDAWLAALIVAVVLLGAGRRHGVGGQAAGRRGHAARPRAGDRQRPRGHRRDQGEEPPMSASDQADSLAAARAEVEQAREELGETVEALAHKANIKGRAHDKVKEAKDRAQQTAHQVQAKAHEVAPRLQAKAQEAAAEAQARAGTLAEPTAVAAPPPTPGERSRAGRPGARGSCSRASSSFHSGARGNRQSGGARRDRPRAAAAALGGSALRRDRAAVGRGRRARGGALPPARWTRSGWSSRRSPRSRPA